jgi:hypothetical protein
VTADASSSVLHAFLRAVARIFTPSWGADVHSLRVSDPLQGVMMYASLNLIVVAAFFLILAVGLRFANRF